MFISVTAPKKGMGQTQTAINIAASLTQYIDGKILLGDINQYSQDIEYYFSDTHVVKGLDNLISLISSNLLNEDNFVSCTKAINESLDILMANECFELTESCVESLISCSKKIYDSMVFDTISGNHFISKKFFELSDCIVVVLNQYQSVCDLIAQNATYERYKEKIVFVINRYQDAVKLGLGDIKSRIREAGFDGEVFPIQYDVEMINDSNDHSVLNYILNSSVKTRTASTQVGDIVSHIAGNFGNGLTLKKSEKKSGIFSFFGKKG